MERVTLNLKKYIEPLPIAGYTCPDCGAKGRWRRGVHFEHEMICHNYHTWDPEEVVSRRLAKSTSQRAS